MKHDMVPVIDWAKYVEVSDMECARYDLSDTLSIRNGSHLPRYFVCKGSKGTKEKQREIVEVMFNNLSKATAEIIQSKSKEKIYRHFLKFIKLQEEFPQVCLIELDIFVEGIKDLLNMLKGNSNAT